MKAINNQTLAQLPMCDLACWDKTHPKAAKANIFVATYLVTMITGHERILCGEHLEMEKRRVATACWEAAETLPDKMAMHAGVSALILRPQLKQLIARPGSCGLFHWEAMFRYMGSRASIKEKREVHGLWNLAEALAVEHRDLQRAVRIEGACRCHFGSGRRDRNGGLLLHPGLR